MQQDGISTILNIMRTQGAKDNPPSLMLGKVSCINPILVQIGDLQLDKDDLYINKTLLEYNRDINLSITVASDTVVVNSLPCKTLLKTDSIVVLYPIENNQKYIVLCEVI